MKAYENLIDFLVLYDRLQAPPVTPEERNAILTEAVASLKLYNNTPSVTALVNRLATEGAPPCLKPPTLDHPTQFQPKNSGRKAAAGTRF